MTTEGEGLIMMWLKRATTTGTRINSPRILIKRVWLRARLPSPVREITMPTPARRAGGETDLEPREDGRRLGGLPAW